MFKRSLRWMLAAASTVVVLTGGTMLHKDSKAGSVATEQTMAGINLSLDKYADAVLAETSAEEDAEQKKKEDTTLSGEEVSSKDTAATTVVEAETDEEEEDKEDTSHFKLNLVYDRLGVADVDSYLNVRSKPSESAKIVGKMTRHSGCNVYHIKKGWAKIISGGVRGYVKASYLITDEKAEDLAKKIANLRASVTTETLNVRYLPSTDARIYDQISEEDEYDIVRRNLTKDWLDKYISKHCKKSELKEIDQDKMQDDLENWMCISIDNEKAFVSKDFVKVTYNLDRAVKIHADGSSSDGSGSSGSSAPSGIVSYAMQFLGNRYVWGGTSLTNGTDCSGFVMRIYEHFGHYLPRTSAAQAAATRTVSASEVRPGDLFFYGSGGVSHVGMYIGNGQIIHASSARTGIKISYAYYRTPIKIGRVV